MGGAYVIGRDRIANDARRLDEAADRGDLALTRALARSIRESLVGQPASDRPPLLRFQAPHFGDEIPDPSAYPAALVPCPLLSVCGKPGRLLLAACIQRQTVPWEGRSKHKDGTSKQRRGKYAVCASGSCSQGRANKRRAPEGWKPPRYNPLRRDQKRQREAMERDRLTTLPFRREAPEPAPKPAAREVIAADGAGKLSEMDPA